MSIISNSKHRGPDFKQETFPNATFDGLVYQDSNNPTNWYEYNTIVDDWDNLFWVSEPPNMYGYDIGGYDSSGNRFSTIEYINFKNESFTTAGFTLDIEQSYQSVFNSSSAGYTTGGSTSADTLSTIKRMDFATQTSLTDIGTLGTQLFASAGANSNLYGFNWDGHNGSNQLNTLRKYDFATASLTESIQATTDNAFHNAGAFNSTSATYSFYMFMTSEEHLYYKYVFGSGTTSLTYIDTGTGGGSGGMSPTSFDSTMRGYAAFPRAKTNIFSIQFSTDSWSTIYNLSDASNEQTAGSGINDDVKAFLIGGYYYDGSVYHTKSTISKFVYDAAVFSTMSYTLSVPKSHNYGFDRNWRW